MTDLNQLSPHALAAAMKGGTRGWGQVGSSRDHVRYSEPLDKKSRKRCYCGCGNKKTHRGMANGVALTSACELGIARWVSTGDVRPHRPGPIASCLEGKNIAAPVRLLPPVSVDGLCPQGAQE